MPIYKSPSTTVRDVDLSPKKTTPQGTPAIMIGTARRGPAFVPITIGDFDSFVGAFGDIDSTRFGPLAMKRWINGTTTQAGSYIRVLGIGDGKKRADTGENQGKVNSAGFLVGQELIQDNGMIGPNPYAGSHGNLGRTYVLGCFMSESNSTVFSEAGIQTLGENKAAPIIRGVLLTPSGVHLSLNTEAASNNKPQTTSMGSYGATADGGLSFGDVLVGDGAKSNFIVILNGHKNTDDYPNSITASFTPGINPPEGIKSIRYAFNTDPTKLEVAGHLLKNHYDISENFAVLTASQVTDHRDSTWTGVKTDALNYKLYQTAFLLTSSLDRNKGSTSSITKIGVPNFENFENRFTHGFSPFVFSQKISGIEKDLFRFHTLDSGYSAFGNYKITISNITPKENGTLASYPTFDLYIRRIAQADFDFTEIGSSGDVEFDARSIESYIGLDLDPSSNDFIAKRIGDMNSFFDFDKNTRDSQKIVKEGKYPNISNILRVEVSNDVMEGSLDEKALPFGFRGLHHLVTTGETIQGGSILTGTSNAPVGSEGSLSTKSGITSDALKNTIQPPVPLRESLFVLNDAGIPTLDYCPTWGIQIEDKLKPHDPNSIKTFLTSTLSYMDYMPDFHTSYQNLWVGNNHGQKDVGTSILDSDRFNNNVFSLGRIEVLTVGEFPDKDQWVSARYQRSGKPAGVLQKSAVPGGEIVFEASRFVRPEDLSHDDSRRKLSFTLPIQGGFDGTNIFNFDKSNLTNNAIIREAQDTNQGGRKGPTITSYNTALSILEDRLAMPGNMLFVPGIRNNLVTSECVSLCDKRFDIFFIKDLEEKGHLNQQMTSSIMGPFASIDEESTSITNAVSNIRNNFLQDPSDSSFGAAYYPDVFIKEDIGGETITIRVPPSVCIAGVYGNLFNNFSKPLGSNRGVLKDDDIETIKLTDKEIDDFFQAGINVIASDPEIPGSGPFIRSQKTLKASNSDMTKISIRRMLIEVRSRIREIMRTEYLFSQNNFYTASSMKTSIEKELVKLQAEGAFRYAKVDVPGIETTSSSDIENYIIRAKVIIRPNNVPENYILDLEEAVSE